MTQSTAILVLALAGVLGNIIVLAKWRKVRAAGSRNLAIAALICLGSALLFAFDLFTQVWVARPSAISGSMFLSSGFAFLGFTAAAVVTLIASRRRHGHAAA
jgi:uncharacterized membrane protein YhiD involved in acid resistance